MNTLELTKDAEAYGRLLALANEGLFDENDIQVLDAEINKTAGDETLSEADQYFLGRVAAAAYAEETEKIAACKKSKSKMKKW